MPVKAAHKLLHLLTAGALLLQLTACSEAPDDNGTGAVESVYRHSMDGAPRSLDPAHASSIYAKMLVVNLYDTLYRYKYLARPYQLAPNLAEGLPRVSSDGLIYTIRIRPGVYFMDDPAFPGSKGRAVTAEDVVYSLKRHFDPATRAQGTWLWQDRIVGLDQWRDDGSDYDREVPGLRALDEHTVQIQLISPFPQLTHTLAQGFSAIVPREAVQHYGREFPIHPVGSGPYRLQSFNSSSAVLQRNAGFRQQPFSLEEEGYDPETQSYLGLEHLDGKVPPFTDRIEVEFIAEDAARWNAFISGETDFIKVPVTQFDQVLSARDPPVLTAQMAEQFQLAANLESGFVHTDFNMDDRRIGYHPNPDQDARNRALRCAIIKAFDWQKRNDVFYYGIGKVFPGIIPPVSGEYNPEQHDGYTARDIAGARKSVEGFRLARRQPA